MTEYSYTSKGGLKYSTGFGFKKIWVIESLRDGDRKTGKELYEDVLCFKAMKDSDLKVELVEVNSKIELLSLLERIKDELKKSGQIPLIHFETHGDKEGLQLKSSEFIKFEDMFPLLSEINKLTRNNLFIVGAACHGGYFSHIIHPTDRAPFWGICGPTQKIYELDIIKGYRPFYDELIESDDMNAALDRLKAAIPHQADNFHVFNSESIFILVFKNYIEKDCSPEGIEKRIERMKKEIKHRGDTPLTKQKETDFRNWLSSQDSQKYYFERYKKTFFFHDIYPEETSLPNPSFEYMLKAPTNIESGS